MNFKTATAELYTEHGPLRVKLTGRQGKFQAKGTACTKAHKAPGTENLKLGLFRKMKTRGRHDPRIFAGCLRHTVLVLILHPSVSGRGPAGPSVPLDQVPRDLR